MRNDRASGARCALALLGAIAGCAELATPTQVILWFDAERSTRDEIASVALTVESDGVVRWRSVAEVQAAKLPKLVLAPLDDDERRRYRVHAEARARDETPLATVELRSGYVAGEARYARLVFDAACRAAVIELEPRKLGRSRDDTLRLRACDFAEPLAADGGDEAGSKEPQPTMDAAGPIDASPIDSAQEDGGVAGDAADACGTADRPCPCPDGSVPFDAGCRPQTPCERQHQCAEDCQVDGETYRCVCSEGGIARPGADGRCWHWRPRERVDVGTGDVRYSNLAMNPAGVAIAIWFEQLCPLPGCGSDVETRLWASRYEPGKGWRAPQLLRSRAESEIDGFSPSQGSPAVALDDAGNALVLWQETETPDTRALHALLLPAESWGSAIELESPGPILAQGGLLERDPSGGFYVASTSGSAFDDFGWWMRRFTPAGKWEPRIELSTPADGLAALAFTIGVKGELTFLWKHASGQVQAARLVPAAPSSLVRMPIVGSTRARDAVDLDVSVNAKGDALAVWLQATADESGSELYWSEAFGDARWWWEARLRAANVAVRTHPRTTFDGSNRGTMSWIEAEGASARVYAANLQQAPVMIDRADVGVSNDAQLAGDALGNVTAIWSRTRDDRYALWANRLDHVRWGGPTQLEGDAALVTWPRLAVSAAGDALVIWHGKQDGRVVLFSRAFR